MTAIWIEEPPLGTIAACLCCTRRAFVSTIQPANPEDDSQSIFRLHLRSSGGTMEQVIDLCDLHVTDLNHATQP
jgi:hypothetical protein